VRHKLVELLRCLYRYLYRLCGESHLAEDLAQDAVVSAMRSLAQLDSLAALRVRLFRIDSNIWRDQCRCSNVKKLYEEELEINRFSSLWQRTILNRSISSINANKFNNHTKP
jgi:DNA-directed RNA polymerase specialized sigma24 family protein